MTRPIKEQAISAAVVHPGCGLGTSFALRRRAPGERPLHGGALVDEALSCGAAALVVCEGLPGEVIADLQTALSRRRDELPVLAVAGGVGAALLDRPALSRASVCSLDRDEARAAAEGFGAAVQLAQELGAPYVVLSLGAVESVRGRWDGIRRHFLRGELIDDLTPAEQLMEARDGGAGRHLTACRRQIEGLLAMAERRGVTLLLKNPRRAIEMPSPLELSALLEEMRGAPLLPLLDLPAAHLTSAMRLRPLRDTVVAFGSGPLGYLGDACGAVGALAPGHGEVDVAAVARHLPTGARRAFIPWGGLRLDEVSDGLRGVEALPRRLPEVKKEGPGSEAPR